jgi:Flp pilus assembly pilin Flp
VIFDGTRKVRDGTASSFTQQTSRTSKHHRIIALNAAEGRCNRMKIRDWIELFRIQLHREDGQTMAEYGVVLAVITVGVVAAIGLLAVAISGKLGAVTKVLTG